MYRHKQEQSLSFYKEVGLSTKFLDWNWPKRFKNGLQSKIIKLLKLKGMPLNTKQVIRSTTQALT